LKFAIELDGFVHDGNYQMEKDFLRDKYLKKFVIYILRFRNVDIKNNIEDVLNVIYKNIIKKAITFQFSFW